MNAAAWTPRDIAKAGSRISPLHAQLPSLAAPAVAAALLAGITLAMLLPRFVPQTVGWCCVISGLIAAMLAPPKFRAVFMLLLGFGWASVQGARTLELQLPASLELQTVMLEGRIASLPTHEARRTHFEFEVDDAGSQPEALRGRTLQLSWYDPTRQQSPPSTRHALRAGERWRFPAALRAPRGLRNPGGFDSERQRFAERIVATGILRKPERDAVRLQAASGVEAWRERMSDRIIAGTHAASARFIAALALGDTRALSDTDWQLLRAAGLTHLIAISGFHVGIVGAGFAFLIAGGWWCFPVLGTRVPRRVAASTGALLGASFYLVATGASLPTLRTVVMIAVVAGAVALRRFARVAQIIALALSAMLLADPLSVLAPGFWLSFGGVLWLAWCLQSTQHGVLKPFVAAQWVVTLGLLPLTVLWFGQASLVSPLLNLIAVPWWSLVVVPLALLGTAAEMLHAGWGEPLWTLAAWLFDPSWRGFGWVATHIGSAVTLPQAAGFAFPLALVACAWWLMPRGMPGRWLAGLLWLPLLWPHLPRPQSGEVFVHMLDVGQGLAIVVQTEHHQLLYDAGPAMRDGFDAGERVVVPAMRALGLRSLERVIISHGDNDHAGGLDAVRRALRITRLLAPEGAPVANAQPCVRGDHWTWDGVTFRFLHPGPHFPYLGNEASCVLRIEAGGRAAVLSGDIDALIEQRLVDEAASDLRADIVTMPHHGSGGSSSEAFIAAAHARWTPVSAGYANRFRHPRDRVMAAWQAAGAATPVTMDSGALTFRMGAGGIALENERSRAPRPWDAVMRRAGAVH